MAHGSHVRESVALEMDGGERVPAILQRPRGGAAAPAVLLMINGRYDRTIRPEQARRLFDAAREPKEQRWYDGGHWPPSCAIDQAAEWLAAQLHQPQTRVKGA